MKVSACLIVKNEVDHIERCMSSLKGRVDEIVVVDTGSTDKTVEIAQSYGANVFHFDWVDDFSKARNFSMDQATGDWILIIDADEELRLSNGNQLRDFVNPEADALSMRMINLLGNKLNPSDQSVITLIRLFKNTPQNRYQGKIHEQVLFSGREVTINQIPVEIVHYGYLEEVREDKNKKERNIRLLEQELAADPDSGFHQFNLGMEYMVENDKKKALHYFEMSFQRSGTNNAYYSRLLRNLSVCYLEEKMYTNGVGLCKFALKLYPDYTDIWYIYALHMQRLNNYEEAIQILLHTLELGDTQKYWSDRGTGSYKAIFTLGEIYLTQGQVDQAIGLFEVGVSNYPHVFAFYPQLAELYIKRKDMHSATRILQQGAKIHPQLMDVAKRSQLIIEKIENSK